MSDWTTGMDFVQLGGICILIVLFLFKNYVTPYIRKKGENLATKQDIRKITDEIEKVRSVYAKHLEDISQQNRLILEQAKQKHELRVAALDRRLEAHQHAFALWRRLLHKVYDEEIGKNCSGMSGVVGEKLPLLGCRIKGCLSGRVPCSILASGSCRWISGKSRR